MKLISRLKFGQFYLAKEMMDEQSCSRRFLVEELKPEKAFIDYQRQVYTTNEEKLLQQRNLHMRQRDDQKLNSKSQVQNGDEDLMIFDQEALQGNYSASNENGDGIEEDDGEYSGSYQEDLEDEEITEHVELSGEEGTIMTDEYQDQEEDIDSSDQKEDNLLRKEVQHNTGSKPFFIEEKT